MDALVEYGDAIRRNIDRVQAVRVDQLAGPTPCRDWDVTALLTHLIGCPSTIHRWLSWPPGTGWPPRRAWMRWRRPGALQRVVALPIGEVPAEVALGMALTDAVVHGWDLAADTG
jgi:Mycothiol maleylpyruvate isomerase N-terminal domain